MRNTNASIHPNTDTDKIAIAINTSYQGKPRPYETGRMVRYKGKLEPEIFIEGQPKLKWWAWFNDGFKPYTVSIEDLGRAIQKGFAIAPICKGRRKASNFVSAHHIGLDFDTETDACRLDTLQRDPFIAQYGAIVHTTSSHTPDKPRARVIFILDQTITDPDEYKRYVAALLDRFQLADQSASDPARCFFGAIDCEVRYV